LHNSSSSILSYNRPIASSAACSPNSASSCIVQYFLISLRSSKL
jgi:hypothetical protein